MEMTTMTHHAPFVVRHRTGLTWIPGAIFFAGILGSRGSLSDAPLSLTMEVTGYVLIGVASLGRIWCGIYIAGRKNKELCQDGPYSLCRNPLYVFSFLGMLGVALGARAPWAAMGMGVAFWVYYYFVINSEEATLRDLFGGEFERYRQTVPMAWPTFSNFWSRKELLIQPKKIIQAILDASWFLWMIVALELIEPLKAAILSR